MYRLLVAENSKPTDGDFVEIVGHYNPTAKDQPLTVNKERVQYWISKGARPTNSVSKLLNRTGFELPVEEGHRKPKQKAKTEPTPVAAGAGDAVIAPTEEKPVAEEAPKSEEAPATEEKSADQQNKPEVPAEPEMPALALDESDSGKPASETDSGGEA